MKLHSALTQSGLFRQFTFFLGIGGIATGIQYFILILLIEFAQLKPFIASTCGFTISLFFNYWMNYKYTFRSLRPHRETFKNFFSIALFGLIFNSFIVYVGNEVLHYHYFPAQIVATIGVLFVNFLANKFWTFSQVRESGPEI